MSYKEIHVNIPQQPVETPRKHLRLTPIGWIAVIILVGLVISSALYAARIIRDRTMTLADLPRRTVVVPTATPTRTPTPGPTATPLGWTLQRDPVTGEQYLSPPPDVEAQIREAFEAVLGCTAIEDVPDEIAVQYDREAALEKAEQLAVPKIVEYYRQQDPPAIRLVIMGPENPVRCEDYDTCVVARAKVGSNGAIVYSETACSSLVSEGTVCVVRPPVFEDGSPYALFLATVESQGNESWIVTDLQVEKLPKPPAAPGS